MKKINLFVILLFIALNLLGQRSLSLEECRSLAISHNNTIKVANENVKASNELAQAAFTQFLPNFSAIGNYTWNQKNISLMGQDAYLPVGVIGQNGEFGVGTPTSLPKPNGDGTFSMDGLAISNKFAIVNNNPIPLDAEGNPFDPKKNPEKLIWKNHALLPKDALELDMRNIFVGGINFVQPIYMGGKIRELNKIAGYTEKIAEVNLQKEIEELILKVDEAYWRVVSLENKVKLSEEYNRLVSKLDTNMNILLEEGMVTKADVLKVKVKLNEADVSSIKAKNGLNLSRMALNQLIGLPLEEKIELSDAELNESTDIQPLVSIEEALNNRPEIELLNQAHNIALSNKKIMESRFMPNIALTGNYLLSNPNSFNGFENKFAGMFSFGVTATVPLFHFGERFHTLNASKSAARVAELKLKEASEKIELEINQKNYLMLESLKKQSATQKNIEQAQENLDYANEGFKEGVITSTDLLGAQTAWLSAKSEYIDAAIDVKLHNTYLKKALGILSGNYSINENKKNK